MSKLVGGVPSSKLNLRENADISRWLNPRHSEGAVQHPVSMETPSASLFPRRTPEWYSGPCLSGKVNGVSPGPDPREARVREAAEHLLATEKLHSQKCKDDDEQEKEEQQADDGFHGVEKRDHQVPERCPVPANRGQRWDGASGWARAVATEPTFPVCPPPQPPSASPHL